jgi:ribosome biogenesis GTPase A
MGGVGNTTVVSTLERSDHVRRAVPLEPVRGSARQRSLSRPHGAGSAEFVRAAHRPEDFIRDGRPAVAFVGRSNVGKSSLLNVLAGSRKLARTGSTPGRTRSVNYFLDDGRYYLVDLPGYGYA